MTKESPKYPIPAPYSETSWVCCKPPQWAKNHQPCLGHNTLPSTQCTRCRHIKCDNCLDFSDAQKYKDAMKGKRTRDSGPGWSLWLFDYEAAYNDQCTGRDDSWYSFRRGLQDDSARHSSPRVPPGVVDLEEEFGDLKRSSQIRTVSRRC